MDLVLKLRELRRLRGMSQKDVARMSGIGEKTISSFETGDRIGSMKISQLRKLLNVYRVTEADFFSFPFEQWLIPTGPAIGRNTNLGRVSTELAELPEPTRSALVEQFRVMVESASRLSWMEDAAEPHHEPHAAFTREATPEWQMLTSRN